MLLPSSSLSFSLRAIWLVMRWARSASPAVCAERSHNVATLFLVMRVWRADYYKPSYFRSSDQFDGLRAASGWREVGFNVLPALIRL